MIGPILAVTLSVPNIQTSENAYKNIYDSVKGDQQEEKRYTALGALHMYINFIMIFVQLLKFLGNRD